MGERSRRKGAAGELEIVHILRNYGFPARRGDCLNHEPDIVGGPHGLHFEIKRTERLSLNQAFSQSTADAVARGEIPAVVHRASRMPWRITMGLTDFLDLCTNQIETETK